MAIPKRTGHPLPDPTLDTFKVGHDQDEPAARPGHSQVLSNDSGSVIEVLNQAGRIDQVEGVGTQGRLKKILADSSSRQSLKSKVGAQQPATTQRKIAAKDFAAELAADIGQNPRPSSPHLKNRNRCSGRVRFEYMAGAAKQANRFKVEVSNQPELFRPDSGPPTPFPIGNVGQALQIPSSLITQGESKIILQGMSVDISPPCF